METLLSNDAQIIIILSNTQSSRTPHNIFIVTNEKKEGKIHLIGMHILLNIDKYLTVELNIIFARGMHIKNATES